MIHSRHQKQSSEAGRAGSVSGGQVVVILHSVVHREDGIALSMKIDNSSIVAEQLGQVGGGGFHVVHGRLWKGRVSRIDACIQVIHRSAEHVQRRIGGR